MPTDPDPTSKLYDEQVVSMALTYNGHPQLPSPSNHIHQQQSTQYQEHKPFHNGNVTHLNVNESNHIGTGTSELVLQTTIEKHKNIKNTTPRPLNTATTPTSQNDITKRPPRPPPKTKSKPESSKKNGQINHGYLEPINAYDSNYSQFAMNGYEIESTEI